MSLEQIIATYRTLSLDPEAQREQLAATAFEIAQLHVEAGDVAAAGDWYRAAVCGPRWEDDENLSCWQDAVVEYALWAHRHVGVELCEAWAFRLVEDAAERGPLTRAYMASEYKTYRNKWQIAKGAESARHTALLHLVAEHDLPQWQRTELVRLLSNSRWFGQADWEQVRDAVDSTWPGDRSWAAVAWLLDGLAAPIFRSAHADDAADLCERFASQDLRERGYPGWADQLLELDTVGSESEKATDFERSLMIRSGYSRSAKQLIVELLERVGLGPQRNLFLTTTDRQVEDKIWNGTHDSTWRLLRGSSTWLAMFGGAAMQGEADAWKSAWEDAGGVVVLALQSALDSLADQVGTDWTAPVTWGDPLHTRWYHLIDALRPVVTGYWS